MRKTMKKLWSNSFVRGGALFTFSSFLINIINYFFNLLAARSLGPRGYSEVTALFSYISIVAVPSLVFSMFVVQKISASGEKKYSYAVSVLHLFWEKIKKWWFIPIIILIFSPFVSRLTNLAFVSGILLIPLIILTFVTTFYGAVMQGLQLFFLFSSLTLFGVTLKLLGAVFTSLGVDGIQTILFFIFLSAMIPMIANIAILKSYLQKKILVASPKLERSMLSLLYNKQFLLILLSTLAITMLNNVDIIFVKKFFNAQNAGIYGSWSLLAKIIFYALGPTIAVSFIFFSSAQSEKHRDKTLIISLLVLAVVAIASYFFYKFFALLIISLFFGPKFQTLVPYVSQASIFGSLYSAIQYINSYFIAIKSKLGLLLFLLMPIYAILLFYVQKTLISIIRLEIFFSAFVVTVYLAAYIISKTLYSNSKSLD